MLFCSLHADPDLDYPFFWGSRLERGEGRGTGCNHNWPLPDRSSENDYLAAMAEAIAIVREFKPAFLVLSAGFDFMESDPVPLAGGAFQVGATGLMKVARMASDLALPTVIIQEGGYDVERLGGYVTRFLTEFVRTPLEG